MKKFILFLLITVLLNPPLAECSSIINKKDSSGGNSRAGNAYLAISDTLDINDSLKYALANNSDIGNAAPKQMPKEEETSFSINFLYFIGAAALAAIVYIVWPEKDKEVKTKATFGTPVQPK